MNYYVEVLKKYVVFSGRARRKEYWMFVLFNFIIGFVLGLIDTLIFGGSSTSNSAGIGILSGIYSLAVFLPSLAVTVRRLHDTSRSGWWILISFIPLIGAIVLLVFFVLDSKPGPNQYGENPKE